MVDERDPQLEEGGIETPVKPLVRPAGSCLMVSVPMPGHQQGVPADIGRAMKNASEWTDQNAQKGAQCRVEVFDGLPPYLRAKLKKVAIIPLEIPSVQALGAVVDRRSYANDATVRQLDRSAEVLYRVCSEVRDLLGLGAIDVRRHSATLHEPLDRSRLLGLVQNAPGVLYAQNMEIEGKMERLGDYLGREFIPGFIPERRDGKATQGDILYGYLQIARTVQKLIRHIVVFVYHRERKLVPAAKTLLLNIEGLSEAKVADIMSDYLPVSKEIEGFEFKKDGKGNQLRPAPPYIMGQARVPLYPVSTRSPAEYFSRHFSTRDRNAQLTYIKQVILPILQLMHNVASGGNTKAYDALYHNTIITSESLDVDNLIQLAQTSRQEIISARANELVRLFAAAYVFPINNATRNRFFQHEMGGQAVVASSTAVSVSPASNESADVVTATGNGGASKKSSEGEGS